MFFLVNEYPVLKADAIKYVMTFRQMVISIFTSPIVLAVKVMNVELWLLFVSAAAARNTGSMRSTPHQAAAVQQQSRQQLCRQHPRKTIHCEDGCRHCSVRHSHVICRKFECCMLQLACLVLFILALQRSTLHLTPKLC